MTVFPFELPTEDSLIELACTINDQNITLALDTGATHTTIDLSFLLVAGIDLTDAIGTVEIETAKGPVEAYLFKIDNLTALGITLPNFTVCAYDFLSYTILSTIDGVIGLDFFKERDLTISFSAIGDYGDLTPYYPRPHELIQHGSEQSEWDGQIHYLPL